jgi:hypothetical protein
MDDFLREQFKEISQGGYKCPCCSDVGGKKKSIRKQQLHKRARTRLRHNLIVLVKENQTQILE